MLEVMLPFLAPVQAPVVVNPPPAVNAPLVAAVVNAPAGVQQLVGQIQDLVVQNVTIVQPPVVMEVEDDNEVLKRLFLKKFGRELPEPEKERNEVDDIVGNMDLIDLTNDDDEMEVATPAAVVVVVKTEAPEAPEAAPIDDRRRSSRLERASLRKTNVIQEKEAPLAAENVIADTDADMAEDVSNVNTVNVVGSVNTESGKTYEQIMADIDAAINDNTD